MCRFLKHIGCNIIILFVVFIAEDKAGETADGQVHGKYYFIFLLSSSHHPLKHGIDEQSFQQYHTEHTVQRNRRTLPGLQVG